MSHLVLDRIAKRFGSLEVLRSVSLALDEGEIVALLGPSGSGKTTLLRILAGFESADAGAIRLAGERVDSLRPEKRGFGMVFQHYALFPHLDVAGNVAFGLEARRVAKAEIGDRVATALARVDLAGFERRPVGELSGGQQQRVALARALAPEPRVLLLDEPLSNLDPTLRERTRRDLAERLRTIGVTTVLVTHEQEEAFELGERVALLDRGDLAQVGRPAEIYSAPGTRFVAGFVGRGSFLSASVSGVDPTLVDCAVLARTDVPATLATPAAEGEAGELFVRPEELERTDGDAAGAVAVRVRAVRFNGPVSWVVLETELGPELEMLVHGSPPAAGETLAVRLRPDARPRFFPSAVP